MSRPRRFDWDEAARLRADGWTYAAIAQWLGVSTAAVHQALKPEVRAANIARKREWQRSGVCVDCGTRCTRIAGRVSRCRHCATLSIIAVRDGEAWCSDCQAWRPLEAFTRERSLRGVRRICRSCDTKRRREYRRQHPDVDAAAVARQRERRRARRAGARDE